MRNTINDASAGVKVSAEDSLDLDTELGIMEAFSYWAESALGVQLSWLRHRGVDDVARRSDYVGDRALLRTVGRRVFQLGGVA